MSTATNVGGRKSKSYVPAIGDPPQPLPTGTPNTLDPCVGECKDIGNVTVHMAPPDPNTDAMWFDWDPGDLGSTRRYLGQVWRLDKALLSCAGDKAGELVATAQAVATYLQANGRTLTSATQDIITYAGVYLIGGASALEFLGAVAAVLSLMDWLALMATVGLTAFEGYNVMKCAIDRYPVTQ